MSIKLSPAKKAWITRKMQDGNSKYQTAFELNLCYSTVRKYSKNFPSNKRGYPGIRGETLELMKELLKNGYMLSSEEKYIARKYQTLKKYFPNIVRVKTNHQSIIFLEDKAEIAARVYISKIEKKVLSFSELKKITDIFGVTLSKTEKYMFVGKKEK